MPVSLERLIAEVEPSVITEELTRECIQVTGTDQDAVEEKQATMRFRDVECLAFSFCNLARIDNLHGLNSLTKLQLDNNHIPKIENIAHLTNLTWLDLSFNKIARIEGLDTLTKLTDLSLYNNSISKLEGLEKLTNINVLSLGNNAIATLDSVGYLRHFPNLRMVNLAGNPISKDRDYKGYILSHLKNLTYLDYRRVAGADVATALEQHQDEVLELREREEQAETEAAQAAERASHAALMAEANLDGVESLFDDMVGGDPDWAKMAGVPGLLEGWGDVREKFNLATEEFKAIVLESHGRKKEEHAAFKAALTAALEERDGEARRLIAEFEKSKKSVARMLADVANNGSDVEHHVSAIKAKLMGLKDALLDIEMDTLEVVAQLCQEFDRAYTEMAESNKLQYNAYFTQVRDLKNTFCSALTAAALPFLEKYGSSGTDNPELEAMPEEAQLLLSDKDSMMSAIQTSHDAHIARIDGLEDRLVASELRRANELADSNSKWEARRHRDRTAEILAYLERNVAELDVMTQEVEGDAGQQDS